MAENTPASGSESDVQSPPEVPVGTAEGPSELAVEEPAQQPESPAPMAAVALEPSPAAPPFPPAPRRKGGRRLAVVLLVIVVVSALGGAGAYIANASLSQTYGAQKALLTYFDAQKRGDISAMLADATYLRGDGSYEQFFGKDAITAMMAIDDNKAISDVKVISSRQVDSSTEAVTASMMWGGSLHTYDYTVRKNLADTHYVFYNSWKVDIPYSSISFSLPNQAGAIEIDGMALPSASATSVQVIAGYHSVQMAKTPFYDAVSKVANAVEISPNIAFDGKVSASATAAAATAIKSGAYVCDASVYNTCPGHTYHSPGAAYTRYFLTGFPGYPDGIEYTYYVLDYQGDITSGMKLVVLKEGGQIFASGTCTETMTADGSRTYPFTGEWSANLTWSNGAFTATVAHNCLKAKG